MQNKVLKLDSKDNVLIALADLRRGEQISFDSQSYTLESDVPAKHKFATENLAIGANIIMPRRFRRKPKSTAGHRPTCRDGSSGNFWDIADRTARWAREITGLWFPWCSAKTETSGF